MGVMAVSVVVLGWLTGCDDDGVRPVTDGEPRLEGRIVGPQGGPLPEIVVSPMYYFDPPIFGPSKLSWEVAPPLSLSKARVELHFAVAEAGSTTLVVENAIGEHVRTVFAGALDAGQHKAVWATDRDDETLVPNGRYVFVLRHAPGGAEPVENRREIFVFDPVVSSLAGRPLAVTDGDGRFSVPMGLIPVGYELEGTDEEGNSAGIHRVLPEFRLYAFRLEGETILGRSSTQVEILDPGRTKSVVIAIP